MWSGPGGLAEFLHDPMAAVLLGATAQMALTARVRYPGRPLFWAAAPFCLLVGVLVGLVARLVDHAGSPHLLRLGAGISLAIAALGMTIVLPAKIDEETILALTTTFWLTFAHSLTRWPMLVIGIAAALPTIIIGFLAVSRFHPPPAARILLYAWTLIVLISLGLQDFIIPYRAEKGIPSFGLLEAAGLTFDMGFSRVDTSGITGLVYAIYLGSGLALLVDSSASLYWLLPLPLKSLPPWLFTELTTPTMRKDVEFAAMHAKRLAANYTPDQINLWRAAFLVVGQVVLVGVMESLSWGEKGDIVHAIVWIILFSNLHMHGDYANSRHTAGRPV